MKMNNVSRASRVSPLRPASRMDCLNLGGDLIHVLNATTSVNTTVELSEEGERKTRDPETENYYQVGSLT